MLTVFLFFVISYYLLKVGGALSLSYQKSDSKVSVFQNIFELNFAVMGGVLIEHHPDGLIYFFKNAYLENFVMINVPVLTGSGAIFAILGITNSSLVSFDEKSYKNFAELSGLTLFYLKILINYKEE